MPINYKQYHPILFSTPMVQAILQGNKTQTRRILNSPLPIGTIWHQVYDGELIYRIVDSKTVLTHCKCPYGKVGDVLWVRETFFDATNYLHFPIFEGLPPFCYKADGRKIGCHKWKPSIFMPKKACRLFLEITSIRVEKLQDISADDAVNECVQYWNVDEEAFEGGELVADYKNYNWRCDESYEDYHFPHYADPISSFRSLWFKINGEKSWEQNPFVWVINFQRITHAN